MPYSVRIQRLLLAASLLWAAFVFGQSLLPGHVSSSESGFIVRLLQLFPGSSGWDLERVEHLVRKAAHFTEYAVLGILYLLAARSRGAIRGRMTLPLFWGLLTPVADESLQLLVEGRTGQLTDVLIDFSGVLTGMAVCLLILWLRLRVKKSGEALDKGKPC